MEKEQRKKGRRKKRKGGGEMRVRGRGERIVVSPLKRGEGGEAEGQRFLPRSRVLEIGFFR